MWIRLNDATLEGTYIWASGSTSSYRNWLTGNPNNTGNQDYVAFNVNTGVWDDRATADCYQSIVEFNCNSVTGVSATNACGPCPTVTMTETTVAGNCAGNYTIVRTWTATANGQVVGTTTQTITVVDNVAPVIACPATITVNAGQGVCNANAKRLLPVSSLLLNPFIPLSSLMLIASPANRSIPNVKRGLTNCLTFHLPTDISGVK